MRSSVILAALVGATTVSACGASGQDDWMEGRWVRANHPEAWFVAFEPNGSVRFRNESTDREVEGRVTAADTAQIAIDLLSPGQRLPGRLTFEVTGRSDDRLDLTNSEGEVWTLVRYGPLPAELLGRWYTLPRNDPRYFIEFERPNQVLWRRRFGMKRSEDRAGAGWMRGDSLFLHLWGAPPMHYAYDVAGDTLAFQRPGLGPFGRYHREE